MKQNVSRMFKGDTVRGSDAPKYRQCTLCKKKILTRERMREHLKTKHKKFKSLDKLYKVVE